MPIDTHYASNVLSELCQKEKLIRIATGMYLKPKVTRFGPVMPSMYEIIKTVAGRYDAKILPIGPAAENYLGFSTQVPMNVVFLTSGTPRVIKVGKRTAKLRHSVPSTFAYKGEIMPILVVALKSIGRSNIDEDTLDRVYGILKENPEDETWEADIVRAPRWIRTIIIKTKQKISENEQMD